MTKHAGFTFEAQHYPDSVHQPNFPSIILKPEETYKQVTVLQIFAALAFCRVGVARCFLPRYTGPLDGNFQLSADLNILGVIRSLIGVGYVVCSSGVGL